MSPPLQLYLPDDALTRTVPSPSSTVAGGSSARTFGWGRRSGSALVVIEFLAAPSAQEAAQLVEERLPRSGVYRQHIEVLVELDSSADGRLVVLADQSSGSTSPRVGVPCRVTAVVLYSPLRQLEVLSIDPLRLDFDARAQNTPFKAAGEARRAASVAKSGGLVPALAIVRRSAGRSPGVGLTRPFAHRSTGRVLPCRIGIVRREQRKQARRTCAGNCARRACWFPAPWSPSCLC